MKADLKAALGTIKKETTDIWLWMLAKESGTLDVNALYQALFDLFISLKQYTRS